MSEHVLRNKFVNGTMWKMIETIASVAITFIVSLILARLLDNEVFGIIALTNVFINFSEIILQSAFTTPLIQKKDTDNGDYSSVFVFSLTLALLLYVAIFALSPAIANYYEAPILSPVLRVISVMFIFQAFGSVRTAIISRNMQFKTLSKCTVASSILSGALGILAAYLGLGIWALVIQKVSNLFFLNLFLLISIKWVPAFSQIRFSKVKELLGFGVKVFASSLLSFFSDSSISLVTGKAYSFTDLGNCSYGTKYPCDASIFTFQSIASTLLPTLSTCQDDLPRMKEILRKVLQVVGYALFPMMLGLFSVSDRLTIFLLTEKWSGAIVFMRLACLYYIATPLLLLNVQLFHALGNGTIRIRLETIKFIATVALLVFGVFIFKQSLVFVIAVRSAIEMTLALLSIIAMKKSIGYSIKEYFRDLAFPIVTSLIMTAAVMLVGKILPFGNTLVLVIQIVLGAMIYGAATLVIKPRGFVLIKELLGKRQH